MLSREHSTGRHPYIVEGVLIVHLVLHYIPAVKRSSVHPIAVWSRNVHSQIHNSHNKWSYSWDAQYTLSLLPLYWIVLPCIACIGVPAYTSVITIVPGGRDADWSGPVQQQQRVCIPAVIRFSGNPYIHGWSIQQRRPRLSYWQTAAVIDR